MSRVLNKIADLLMLMISTLLVVSCISAPSTSTTEPAAAPQTPAEPVVVEFADAWDGTEIRINTGDQRELEGDRVQVGFRCVWTDGQFAGDVYPQEFVSSETGEQVDMEFTWDSGGRIAEGIYDVSVEVDGRCGGGWIRNLPLKGERDLEVVIDLNACQFALPFDTYREVIVYPSGTYDDFSSRNMLDAIPEHLEITRYNEENLGSWAIAPSGEFDLRVIYADETVEWLQNYELPANARVADL